MLKLYGGPPNSFTSMLVAVFDVELLFAGFTQVSWDMCGLELFPGGGRGSFPLVGTFLYSPVSGSLALG